MRLIEWLRGLLRGWLDVPSWEEVQQVLDLRQAEQQAWLEQRERNLLMRVSGRVADVEQMERRLNKLSAEVERVAAQTTIGIDDMLAVLVTTRKEWEAELEKEQEQEDGE